MTDMIVALVILGIISLAAWYVVKAKKSGKKCIGCPEGGCSACSCGCARAQNK